MTLNEQLVIIRKLNILASMIKVSNAEKCAEILTELNELVSKNDKEIFRIEAEKIINA